MEGEWNLSSFTTDAAGQLYVFWHDSDPLGMDGTQVGILKQTHKVGLAGFLKDTDRHN